MVGPLNRLTRLNTVRTAEWPRPRLKPRGLPPALEPHQVFAVDNPIDAVVNAQNLFGRHRIHLDDDSKFAASFHAVLIRDITIGYIDYSCPVRIEASETTDNLVVLLPSVGSSVVSGPTHRTVSTPVNAVIIPSGESMELTCGADTAHLVVGFDRNAIETHLSRLLGRTVDRPLRFEPAFDLTEPAANRWNFAIQLVLTELIEPASLLNQGIGRGSIEELLMSALLHGQRSNYQEILASPNPPTSASAATAIDYIERHLAEELTVTMVADAAGVSVRTLQKLFATDLNQTPTSFIRNRRLERVRSDLADATVTSGSTVTDIASRWGFTHLGRFSTIYKSRFGESPSYTLRH